MVKDPFGLLVVFSGIVLLALFLSRKFTFARKLSPVILILTISAVFSNLGIVSDEANFCGLVIGFAVPFAVCLVLFKVKLSEFKYTGLAMFVAFAVASMGTLVGVVLATISLNPLLERLIGPDGWKLAGPFAGTYIGGSLNFFALWEGLDIGNPDLFAAANAVDNLIAFPAFLFLLTVPEMLMRFYPEAKIWKTSQLDLAEYNQQSKPTEMRIFDIAALSFMALVVMFVSGWIKDGLLAEYMPKLPTILLITTFALIIAQFKFTSRLEGAMELGNLCFYMFFVAVGIRIDVKSALLLAPVLFIFAGIILATHLLFVFGLGRLLRLDSRVLAVASIAAKSGPASVMAITTVKKWKHLMLPGISVALLGYAVGNYLGFGVAYLLKFILGAG